MKLERHTTVIRVALIYLALALGLVGAYILITPRTFYDDFPGFAQWVSALPPFNEHLIRDFGAAALGLGLLAGLAALWMEKRLVQATAVAFFAANLPHAIYHSTATNALTTADNIASLGALYLQALLPLALIYLVSDSQQAAASVSTTTTPNEASR
jgi:hypothetical protein